MTDIEMLPLPEALFETGSRRDLFNVAQMDGYAFNVAVHNVKERDAEIEALKSDLGDYMDAANYQAARAERLAEALALLPDEIDMIEHNPDEGMLMSCCGREVKSRGLYGLVITHDKDCWYVSMCALRDAQEPLP